MNLVAALLKLDGINPNFGWRQTPSLPNFDWRQTPPLALAAREGHSAIVELLLAMINIDPNIRDKRDATPLLYAINGKHTSIVRQLLARDDIDLNTVGIVEWEGTVTPLLAARGTATPLLAAIESRNMEVINLLLSKDSIDVNFCPQSNMTPLLMAIRHGPMEVVESLFARDDVDLNVVDYDGNHVLLESMGLGLDKVKLILDRSNVDPNIVSPTGRTAIMIACSMEKGDLDLIEFFLHQGIDINRQDAGGRTAFCWAVNSGCSKVVKLLLDRDDMDPNLPDARGHTPLFYCISPFSSGLRRSSDMDIMDLLLRKEGIDVNARDIGGSTALAFACALPWPDRAFDYAGLLLSHGTDPNILDNNGVSALSEVIYRRTHICGTKAYSQNLQKLESLLRAAGAR